MFKSKVISFMKYNKFEFGDQVVSQFVIFECKYLFSIIFFYFHKSNGSQDRFHTHAFNAISIKLWGEYTEHVLTSEASGHFYENQRDNIFQYFPKNRYHRISNSNGCATVLISGPWNKTWKEYMNSEVKLYNWNRVELF